MKLQIPSTRFILTFVLSSCAAFGVDSQPVSDLLRAQAGASDSDLKSYAQADGVFAKVLPNVRKGEIAVAGAVRIPVPIDFFIAQFRHIETFEKEPEVLNIGEVNDPPRDSNLAKLTLGNKELEALATCRPGKCKLKLSAEMMNRLRNTAGLGRGPKLEVEFRKGLVDYMTSYMAKGTTAMIIYRDSDRPVVSSREFLGLLEEFVWLDRYATRLYQALKESDRPAHAEISQFFYWFQESFGLRPVVSVTHVFILKTKMEGKQWAFIASKQIYADHYFQASLGLTVLREESPESNAMISLAYFNRSMTDGLRGWLAPLERSIVERRVRAAMAKNLSQPRDRLKKDYHQPR